MILVSTETLSRIGESFNALAEANEKAVYGTFPVTLEGMKAATDPRQAKIC